MPYHQITLDMLECQLPADPFQQYFLAKCEAAYGFAFPAAVQEWYRAAQATTILATHSNEDQPLELADMFAASYHRQQYDGWLLPHEACIPIMVEREHSGLWCLEFDGTDDPPVVNNWESPGQWVRCAERFSLFVSQQVAGWFRPNDAYHLFSTIDAHDLQVPSMVAQVATTALATVRSYPSGVTHVIRVGWHLLIWERSTQVDVVLSAPTLPDLHQGARHLAGYQNVMNPPWPEG